MSTGTVLIRCHCLLADSSKLKAPRTSGGFTEGQPFASDKLTVTQGSVTNKADVDAVFAAGGVTGVVVALGGKTSDVGATMLQDGTKNIITSMEANGIKRISVVTTIGAGDSMDQAYRCRISNPRLVACDALCSR